MKSSVPAKRAIYRQYVREDGEEDMELPLFDIDVVAAATDQFSFKIGQGGFGEVFRVRKSPNDFWAVHIRHCFSK